MKVKSCYAAILKIDIGHTKWKGKLNDTEIVGIRLEVCNAWKHIYTGLYMSKKKICEVF